MIQHYVQLGLKPGATLEEIKSSFRRQAKKLHPDARGGNATSFARVKESYDALCNNEMREQFERLYKKSGIFKELKKTIFSKFKPAPPMNMGNGGNQNNENSRPNNGSAQQDPVVSRLMSIALPRSGRIFFENIHAQIIIEATTPQNLWKTTLRKFGNRDPNRLINHLTQIRVTGKKELARMIKVQATDQGILIKFDPAANKEDRANPLDWMGTQFTKPLTIRATVPKGTFLNFKKTYGSITIGDLFGEVRAELKGRTILRIGKVNKVGLTLTEKSKAYISRLDGDIDTLIQDSSKIILDGNIGRLRAVVEKFGQMEILAPIKKLQVEANGRGLIHAKNTVHQAHCNAFGSSFIRIAELKTFLLGSRRGMGRIDVVKKPIFVPATTKMMKRMRPKVHLHSASGSRQTA